MTLSLRDPDGSVSHFDIWTNRVPGLMQDPTFLGRGECYKDFLASVKPGNTWPSTVRLSRYRHGEYGTILVDFISKVVTSRQGYCDPEWSSVDLETDRDWLRSLIERGAKLTLAEWDRETHTKTPMPADVQQAILSSAVKSREVYAKSVAKALPKGWVHCYLKEQREGWTFDHKVGNPSHNKIFAKDLATVRNSWKIVT